MGQVCKSCGPVRHPVAAAVVCVGAAWLLGAVGARAQEAGTVVRASVPTSAGTVAETGAGTGGGTSAGKVAGTGGETGAGTGVAAGALRPARSGPDGLPEEPVVQGAGQCTLVGTVRGSDGGIVPGASVTLVGEGRVRERAATSDDGGGFRMEDVPCGQFVLTATMPGFTPVAVSGVMKEPGGVAQQDVTLKIVGQNESVNVVATRTEIAQAQVHFEEHQRMAGVFPNFFVSYQWSAVPLHARQKFGLAMHTATDPATVVLAGAIAGVQQANNSLPGYGQGAAGYGRRFGANLGTEITGTFLGGAILPTIFRQDPRYFYRGTGSNGSRLWYAVSRAFVTRGDNGKAQVNFSGLLGDLGSGAISNLYAADEDRQGASLTVEDGLLGIVGDCVNNTLQEFVLHRVTSKARGRHGQAVDGAAAP